MPERSWLRIRFRKDQDMRLISHLDLTSCFARMLRRAGLAYCSTAGFHPLPRMNFALSLGLGYVGCREVVDIQFEGRPNPDDIQAMLNAQAPAGLTILAVTPRPVNRKAQVRLASYRLAVPSAYLDALDTRLHQLAAEQTWLVQRRRPQPRTIDIRPFLCAVRLHQNFLVFDLWVTPTGTARAEEVLRLLNLEELMSQGAVLERVNLELQDEESAERAQDSSPEPVTNQTCASNNIEVPRLVSLERNQTTLSG